jgi:hypothetical protein
MDRGLAAQALYLQYLNDTEAAMLAGYANLWDATLDALNSLVQENLGAGVCASVLVRIDQVSLAPGVRA